MARAVSKRGGDEARLWAAALCISVLVNLALIAWVSYEAIQAEAARKKAIAKVVPAEQVVKIFPEMLRPEPQSEAAKKTAEQAANTVRTSPDQESADPPVSRRFIGERNTRATSDRAPTADDPNMPSQAGREARNEEIETTESDYQDGKLDSTDPAQASAKPTPPAQPGLSDSAQDQVKGEKSSLPGEDEAEQTAIREKLLEGPNPVEVPSPKAEIREDMKPREEKKIRDGATDGLAEKKVEEKTKKKPQAVNDPAFRGNQSKTALQGNISRNGRSALDVTDSPMGRYQAAISRAVEKEWQLNCMKRRDFIVPGYLTVRFYVQPDGRVKSVQFVGDIEGGEVQKGFTLQSIRDAPIPAMPPGVKKEMGGDALELIFNFYF